MNTNTPETSSLKPNASVSVGPVTFANDAPLAVLAGPCQMESRAHALEIFRTLDVRHVYVGDNAWFAAHGYVPQVLPTRAGPLPARIAPKGRLAGRRERLCIALASARAIE